MNSKIFLDSGDYEETKKIIALLGHLDGQTTNPSLVASNPSLRQKLAVSGEFSESDLLTEYKNLVQQVATAIPNGSVSIEVYADKTTSTDTMLAQAREMFTWINNAHIKLPITHNGLEAANILVNEGIRVNMTLCFSQSQAAAVHAATKGAVPGAVFVSPFIGRLDDIGINGLDLIRNIKTMFAQENSHVELLAASIRNLDHFLSCLEIGADIITSPYKVLEQYSQSQPTGVSKEDNSELQAIEYEELDLDQNYDSFNIQHDLTDKGLEKFAADWNHLLGK